MWKRFLLYEMLLIEPKLEVVGFDSSVYGLENAKEEVKPHLFQYKAQDPYPFGNNEFDLVISLGTFHNLKLFELKSALNEMERVGKNGYLMLESYRNEKELFNLECWALTAESLLEVSEWIWLYHEFGYTGDYEFIFFE
ncbi:methyltransferase domain protein [Leptospira interrogans serovar Copenhageni str. LT2050]|uniref:Methyltransferase domain protein n=1 Tax=Leptospira interrogans serovar Copenhageni str. LT2050 TaxID=1001598 RepID=M3G192_LEPIT|nr:methyltransferase domain protein [Leptospira interrogans serovar Copenhageni str. LT2050]